MSKKLYNFDVVGSLLRPINLREATKLIMMIIQFH